MSIYRRGKSWYVDFTFHGQRIRQMIGSRKDAEKVIAKRKTEINENKFLDKRKDPEPITFTLGLRQNPFKPCSTAPQRRREVLQRGYFTGEGKGPDPDRRWRNELHLSASQERL